MITNPAPLIVNACLTGMVHDKTGNPYLPIDPIEIIEDAHAVLEAGGTILHLHARDQQGHPTWLPEIYAKIIEGIRNAHPSAVICVTTSGRAFSAYEQRAAVLELTGTSKPDMASLTLGSVNLPSGTSINSPEMIQKLALKMKEREILPELEVFEAGMINYARYLANKQILPTRSYVNLMLGGLGASLGRAKDLVNLSQDIPENWIWAAAGFGQFQLPVNTMAIAMGGHVRVGLEDNLYYNSRTRSPATNLQLVERVVRLGKELGRPPATTSDVRKLFGLNRPCSG